jgi:hypothetical protein
MANEPSDEYLKQLRTHTRESIEFFSNANKEEREKRVVRALFRCLGVEFHESDLKVGEREPIDMAARGASFQITEILDENRRRHQELKTCLEELEEMKSDQELFTSWGSPHPVSLNEVVERVCKRLADKASRYGKDQCRELDALVYFNLQATFFDPNSSAPRFDILQTQGWRSVSVVFLPYGLVLYAHPNAPEYLQAVQGSPIMAWKRSDGWFDPEPDLH